MREETTESADPTVSAVRDVDLLSTVIIATCNRYANLQQSLTRLQTMAGVEGAWEILVVDNGSTDATPQVVREFAATSPIPVRYVFEGGRGKSAALNAGVRNARGEIIAFTDDDCLPDRFWLKNVLAEFEAHPNLAVLGGRVELYDERDQPVSVVRCAGRNEIPLDGAMRAMFGTASDAEALGSVIGANMAVRRGTFAKVGLFDLFLAPGSTRPALAVEDCDFAYRACRAGLEVAYSPEPLVWHNHGRRTDSQAEATIRAYNRGRGAFYWKYCLSGDVRVIKTAYWELKGYWKVFWSRHPESAAKRRNVRRILRGLLAGMATQMAVLGRNRTGKSEPRRAIPADCAAVRRQA
jgi:GT2 family glycosyltransferase